MTPITKMLASKDPLTRDERVRLEALKRSVDSFVGRLDINDVSIMRRAAAFERWILHGVTG